MHKKKNEPHNLALAFSSSIIMYKMCTSHLISWFLDMYAFYLNIHVSITKFIFMLNIWRRKSGSGPMQTTVKEAKVHHGL